MVDVPVESTPTEPNAKDMKPLAIAPEPRAYESLPLAIAPFPKAKALEAVLTKPVLAPATAYLPIAVDTSPRAVVL